MPIRFQMPMMPHGVQVALGKLGKLLSFDDKITYDIKKYLPKTQDEFFSRIHSTINRLRDKNQRKINETHIHMVIDLLLPASAITNIEVKREAAEMIAKMEDGAQIITNYMWFLREYLHFLRELGQGCEQEVNEVKDCYRLQLRQNSYIKKITFT